MFATCLRNLCREGLLLVGSSLTLSWFDVVQSDYGWLVQLGATLRVALLVTHLVVDFHFVLLDIHDVCKVHLSDVNWDYKLHAAVLVPELEAFDSLKFRQSHAHHCDKIRFHLNASFGRLGNLVFWSHLWCIGSL